jgi:hypothetical protein
MVVLRWVRAMFKVLHLLPLEEESCITIMHKVSHRHSILLPLIRDIITIIIRVVVMDIIIVQQVVRQRVPEGLEGMPIPMDTITMRHIVMKNAIQVMDMAIGVGIVLEYGIRW